MSDVTRILDRAQQGDPMAADELLPLVYDGQFEFVDPDEAILNSRFYRLTSP